MPHGSEATQPATDKQTVLLREGQGRRGGHGSARNESAERLGDGVEMVGFDFVAVSVGAALQRIEIEGQLTDGWRRLLQPTECGPQSTFAGDSRNEEFQFDNPAERRIRGESAIRLEATDSLSHRRQAVLDRIAGDAEIGPDGLERRIVHFDLGDQTDEIVAELVLCVGRLAASSNRQSSLRPGPVIVEIDGQQIRRCCIQKSIEHEVLFLLIRSCGQVHVWM